jgi:alanine-glyoxylate transaminase/serine-glyoxylate transaminase/serine-pyruvate transaminase
MTTTPLPDRPRILLGPGPAEMHPRVAAALASPLLGYLDPVFLRIMDETQERLRRVYQTANRLTIPVSATGTGGMEISLANLVEPGDRVLAGVHGVFGGRIAEAARRLGAEVATVEAPWGTPLDPDRLAAAIREKRPALVTVIHAETSTGVLLQREEMRRIASAVREADALLLVDCVTSLGGTRVEPDSWPADGCFSGSQKCLACPPGLAPLTLGERAMAKVHNRRSPVPSFYFDLRMIEKYWGSERVYHHTPPGMMIVALREALDIVLEEGLEERFARHVRNRDALVAGLEELELSPLVAPPHRLPMLTPVRIPEGVDDAWIRSRLLEEDSIEIGAGLGPLKGKIWRIGLMGQSSRAENVLAVITALGRHLQGAGHACDPGLARSAAAAILSAR